MATAIFAATVDYQTVLTQALIEESVPTPEVPEVPGVVPQPPSVGYVPVSAAQIPLPKKKTGIPVKHANYSCFNGPRRISKLQKKTKK